MVSKKKKSAMKKSAGGAKTYTKDAPKMIGKKKK